MKYKKPKYKEMIKPALHFFYEPHGSIGEISTDILPYLQSEFDVTIEGVDPEPKKKNILLCHFLNPKVVESPHFKKFRKKVLIQPIDGTIITPYVVGLLNEYDLIFTPGTAGKKILQDNGVKTKIEVIRNFYKDDIFTKPMDCKIKQLPETKVIFYHESTFHPRKGIELLLEAYVKAFSDTPEADNVLLLLKDSELNARTYAINEKLKKETVDLQKNYKHSAKIIKITQDLPWETLKKIWDNVDIYVSLARIEGFGIPLLRMGMLGKPIIALDSELCGYRDWLTSKNSYLVPTKKVIAKDEFMFLYDLKRTQWSTPISIDAVIEQLRKCLEDFRSNKLKLVKTKELECMSLENIAKTYINCLKKV